MSLTRIFLHSVWATKYREPILVQPNRNQLFEHIAEYCSSKGIVLLKINGHFEHVHAVLSLSPSQCIDYVLQLIKGESAYWYNNLSGLEGPKLRWQNDYFVESVSPSNLVKVIGYVTNQERHHAHRTFDAEIALLRKRTEVSSRFGI